MYVLLNIDVQCWQANLWCTQKLIATNTNGFKWLTGIEYRSNMEQKKINRRILQGHSVLFILSCYSVMPRIVQFVTLLEQCSGIFYEIFWWFLVWICSITMSTIQVILATFFYNSNRISSPLEMTVSHYSDWYSHLY